MKRLFFTICLIAAGLFIAQAQTKVDSEKMMKERIENMRMNLTITTQEGKTFWSAYNQFLRIEEELGVKAAYDPDPLLAKLAKR